MPVEIVSTVVTHNRVTKLKLHWPEVRLMIVSQVQTVLGLDPHATNDDIDITSVVTPVPNDDDDDEPIEWEIDVTVTEDLS